MRAILEGGPQPWVDNVVELSPSAQRAERTLADEETSAEFVFGVWKRRDRKVGVEVRRRRRHDVVVEQKEAVVFAFTGRRTVSKEVEAREKQLGLI